MVKNIEQVSPNPKIFRNSLLSAIFLKFIYFCTYQGFELCLKIEPDSSFFQPGDLDSLDTTKFNTTSRITLDTNTFWLDARQGSASCDVPEIAVLGDEYYKLIHGGGN